MNWDLDALRERYQFLFNKPLELPSDIELSQQAIFDVVRRSCRALYEERDEVITRKLKEIEALPYEVRISPGEDKPYAFSTLEQDTFLELLDHYWNIHLRDMDDLLEGIGWRGYGQKNPKHEYQREGFLLFQSMLETMKETVVRKLYYLEPPDAQMLLAQIEEEERRRANIEKQMQMRHDAPPEGGEDGAIEVEPEERKDPDEQRARVEARRKARRKKRK